LLKIEDLFENVEKMKQIDNEINTADSSLKKMEKEFLTQKDLLNQLEMMKQALLLCEEKNAESNYTQSLKEIENFEEQIAKFEKVFFNFFFYYRYYIYYYYYSQLFIIIKVLISLLFLRIIIIIVN
jgi:hypothetical protein